MSSPAQDPARIARRRREHERQAVIFGVLITLLVVAGLGALAIYTGAITAPFARDFTVSSPEAPFTPVCLPVVEDQPDGALPLAHGDVHLNILNATGTASERIIGAASAYRTVLGDQRGFAIGTVGNATEDAINNELRFGVQGIVAAYTVAAQFDEIRMVLDAREDASVDLLVGSNMTQPLPDDEVRTGPLTNVEGCAPADEIDPLPAPAPADTEGDGETESEGA